MTHATPWVTGVAYGAMGFPLAFVALPLMVQWPAYAATAWGLPLAGLGALLLAVRAADAAIDPWIGRRADGWFAASPQAPRRAMAGAGVLLMLGFLALFFRPEALGPVASVAAPGEHGTGTGASPGAVDGAMATQMPPGPTALAWAWAVAALVVTSLGYSLAQVIHMAWAARLGGGAVQRARWVAYREGFALMGVIAASVLPALVGWRATAAVLGVGLLAGGLALRHAPSPQRRDGAMDGAAVAPVPAEPAAGGGARAVPAAAVRPAGQAAITSTSPWQYAGFRRLLVVYLLNGLAAAIPSALVLFFVRDRLQAPAAFEALSLAAYFGCAAAGVPLWMRVVRRRGLVKAWALGMLLSVAAFIGAAALGAGDEGLFLVVCMASGFALGADLVVPPALLAGVVQSEGLQGRVEGQWFGWWTMATKLNLALAAGLTLPLVQALGYEPGTRDPAALQALAGAYAVLPCVIKLAAGAALWHWRGQLTVADVLPGTVAGEAASAAGTPTVVRSGTARSSHGAARASSPATPRLGEPS